MYLIPKNQLAYEKVNISYGILIKFLRISDFEVQRCEQILTVRPNSWEAFPSYNRPLADCRVFLVELPGKD